MADQTKMKVLSIVGAVCVVLLCAAVVLFPLGSKQEGSRAVAATVNGAAIYEDDVTASIEQLRQGIGLSDASEWKRYLQESNLTPEDVRTQAINSMVTPELVKQGAKELGISIDESAVDEYISLVRASAENDDEWRRALEEAGFTEESFRKAVSDMFLEQEVREHFRSVDDPDGDGAMDESASEDSYSKWLQELWDKADIVINDMPADASYNVNM